MTQTLDITNIYRGISGHVLAVSILLLDATVDRIHYFTHQEVWSGLGSADSAAQ